MGAEVQHAVAFADGPGGGNPCPVVLGAGGGADAQMQAAAAAFSHETCFVLEPSDRQAAVRLRYFVPRHEMEMCVHATVAAAVLLDLPEGAAVQTPLGLRRIERPGPGEAVVEQFLPDVGPPVADAGPWLAALGAGAHALGEGPVMVVSTARPKLLIPLADERALDGLQPDFPALWALCDAAGATGVYAFTEHAEGGDAAPPQFPVRAGYDEDPATRVGGRAPGAHPPPPRGQGGGAGAGLPASSRCAPATTRTRPPAWRPARWAPTSPSAGRRRRSRGRSCAGG